MVPNEAIVQRCKNSDPQKVTNSLLAAYFGVDELWKYSLTRNARNTQKFAKHSLDATKIAVIMGLFINITS